MEPVKKEMEIEVERLRGFLALAWDELLQLKGQVEILRQRLEALEQSLLVLAGTLER